MDGAVGPNQSRAGAILEEPNRLIISNAQRFDFPVTNNMAEYEALINGMQLALRIGVSDLNVLSDSQLVTNQVRGIYEARDEIMKRYLARVREPQYEFKSKNIPLQVDLIPQTQNEEANIIS